METQQPIRSMDEFKRRYFPEEHERDRVNKMTPEELGKYLAQRDMAALGLLLTFGHLNQALADLETSIRAARLALERHQKLRGK